ncbi:MAG: carbamoyltransferase [Candidatus Komeilibacteria bacterium]|nr:carbamoyltransferase [Candidatus Komeilibacteria bacterium]
MNILGISCFYHDSAACLLQDGKLISAAQEERFTRKKHDSSFPRQAIKYCLSEAKITAKQLDLVVFYDKPFLKFERILETYLNYAPKGLIAFCHSIPAWLKKKLWIPQLIGKELNYSGKIIYSQHHQAHAASAFFSSPFAEAAILTVDGVGEWATASIGVGRGNQIKLIKEIKFPDSLGLLYSAFTYYSGFKVNSGEYKLMGLAPYGEPKYAGLIKEKMVDIKPDGSFKLNMDYFNYHIGLTMTSKKFHDLFGGPPRRPEATLTQKEMDLASSIQAVTEEIILKMAEQAKKLTGQKYLCLAGGVALNCVANSRLLRQGIFDDLWIQPAAGDAGGALGAAWFGWHQYLGKPRPAPVNGDLQQGSYLGPSFSEAEIKKFLDDRHLPYQQLADKQRLFNFTADLLISEKIIGWFSGRMEFGPRALGSRSIIGDARSAEMQSKMNLKIKFRESFRPFAPSVLMDKAADFFETDQPSPYMLLTAYVSKDKRRLMTLVEEQLWGIDKLKAVRSVIPAVTHIDYSARLQTVDSQINYRYYNLIKTFYQKTNCPVIVNTSFNVRGEPIVCTPEDAYRCFMRTEMDYLILENFILDKQSQPEFNEIEDWRKHYELD